MSYKAYMQGVEEKSGKTQEDLYSIANQKGFIEEDKIVAAHKELLMWLKEEIGLGHVQANFVIAYLRLRTKDPKVSDKMKKWAYETGYTE